MIDGHSAGGTYRSRCHFNGCETRFIGATREDYIEHIREKHSEFRAEIYETLVVGVCDECGIAYKTDSGECPGCADANGTIEGEIAR